MRPLRSRFRLLALLSALTIAAGCGDGGQPQQGQADQSDLHAFCAAAVDAEIAVTTQGPEANVEPLLAEMERSAPEEIQEAVATVVAGVRAAADNPAEFQKPLFAEADETIDQHVVENCSYETVTVSGTEYAFEGIPETLPSGRVSFVFTNEGEELHEMTVYRVNDDVQEPFPDILALGEEEALKRITFLAGSFGPPGSTDAEVLELEPGRYGVACFVPVGTTDEEQGGDGPPHFTEGMVTEFTVA